MRFRRTLTVLCGLLLIGGICWITLRPSISLYTAMFREASQNLCIKKVPQPLSVAVVSPEQGMRFKKFGYEFELPWTGATEKADPTLVSETFPAGQQVFFLDRKSVV